MPGTQSSAFASDSACAAVDAAAPDGMAGDRFDFDAAVLAPFRMQPGLRRLGEHARHLHLALPGSRHQREKLAVLGNFWPQALLARPGFDAKPALHSLARHAAQEHPRAWRCTPGRFLASHFGVAVDDEGLVHALDGGSLAFGDEVRRCLRELPPAWRLAGLLALTFEEDLALIDGRDGSLAWLAVCLPSHWAPEAKIGLDFAAVHAPVADNQLVLRAAPALMKLVTGGQAWERFVWTITDHPRLHAHPARVAPERWSDSRIPAQAWWRTERQSFLPLPGLNQAVFTIGVQVQPLAQAINSPERATVLHRSLHSMSDAVLAYRGLAPVRAPLLDWLQQRAGGELLAANDADATATPFSPRLGTLAQAAPLS